MVNQFILDTLVVNRGIKIIQATDEIQVPNLN